MKLRGGWSTCEEAGGRIEAGMGGLVEGSASNSHILGGSTGAQECLGVEEAEDGSISRVFGDFLLGRTVAISY